MEEYDYLPDLCSESDSVDFGLSFEMVECKLCINCNAYEHENVYYLCVFCFNCNNCNGCKGCENCKDCDFCINCKGLIGGKFMINNQQATLKDIIKEWDIGIPKRLMTKINFLQTSK